MNNGNISEMVLKRSVLKHIRKSDRVTEGGAAAGFDAALFDVKDMDDLFIAEGYADSAEIPKGFDISSGKKVEADRLKDGSGVQESGAYDIDCLYMAYIRACNNLYAAGGRPLSISVSLVMGNAVKEGYVRSMMKNLSDMAAEKGIVITGGDTKITEAMKTDYLTASVTALGCKTVDKYGIEEACESVSIDGLCEEPSVIRRNDDSDGSYGGSNKDCNGKKIKAGDHIIIAGYVGLYGAAVLSRKYYDRLRGRFADSYIKRMSIDDISILSIEKAAETALRSGAKRVHDTSFGGVYAAAYQLAESAGLGVKVRHEDIPVRQDTIELAETLGINPYMLCGTGGLVIAAAADKAEDVTEAIRRETGLPACDAGEFTKEKLRCVYSNNFRLNRVIDMPDGDELFNVFINM